MILGGKNVAAHPANVGAEIHEGFDQHGGLDRHVEAAHDLYARERLALGVACPQHHQTRHLVLGQADLVAAQLGQIQVGHLV